MLLLNILRGENCERGAGGRGGEGGVSVMKWEGWIIKWGWGIRVLIGMTIGICIWLLFLSGEESWSF